MKRPPREQIGEYPRYLRKAPFAILILLFFLAFSGIAAFLSVRHFQNYLQQRIAANREIADLVSLVVSEHQRAVVGILQSYANRRLLVRVAEAGDEAGALVHLAQLVERNPGISAAIIADREGVLWVNHPPYRGARGRSFAHRDWYRGVSRAWEPYVSGAFRRVVGEMDLAVMIAVPILDGKGRPIRILGATQRLSMLATLLERFSRGPPDRISLIDQSGNLLYSNAYPYREELTPYPHPSGLAEALESRERNAWLSFPGEEGRRHVSAEPVEGTGWTVAVSVSEKELLKEEIPYFGQVAGLCLLGFFLFTAVFLYIRKDILFRKASELLAAEEKAYAAARELAEREVFIREVLDHLPIGIAVNSVDPSVAFDYMNDLFPRVYRTTREALREPEAFWDAVYEDPAFREEIRKRVIGDCASGDPERMVWEGVPIARRGGGTTYISARNVPIPGKPQMISMVWDVTERRRAQEAVRESEERFRTAFQTSPDAININRLEDGLYVEINEGFTQLTGYAREETVGRTSLERNLWDEPEDRRRLVEGLKLYGQVNNFETWFRMKNGRRVPGLMSAKLITLKGELHILSITRSIEELKRAQEKMRRLNEELERRVSERTAQLEEINRELEAFSYSVSHDLRAPLRGIDGFGKALLEDFGDRLDETGKDYLNRVRRATQQMGRLIDDMLLLSRLTKAEMRRERVDLTGMAGEVIDSLRRYDPGREVVAEVREGILAQGDPAMLKIVLENLLGNAWKFTSKTGSPRIEFGAEEQDGQTVYFVRDNGVGFNMAYAGKLFGAFQRMHPQEEYPGNGVGLATVQRIIRRHGGRVWAEAETGRGATFSFTLPDESGPEKGFPEHSREEKEAS